VDLVATHVSLVAQGGVSVAAELLPVVVDYVRTGVIPGVAAGGDLSTRELDVLRLVAQGMDNNQIAADLAISAKTVKNHLASIFVKLGVVNRVQAAVYAVKAGIG
jgi:DNA-binding NarL/FixJ family response regulator